MEESRNSKTLMEQQLRPVFGKDQSGRVHVTPIDGTPTDFVKFCEHSIIRCENVAYGIGRRRYENYHSTEMKLNDNKAGMSGLNTDHINAVIRENSGTNFLKHQEKRDQRIQERIARNQRQLESFTPEQISAAECKMDALVDEIEQSRDLSRTIIHVDMDAFYAAVEMRDNPDLREIPMAVGGDHMLSTSNYAARKYGVRAAMPGFIARKLCPHLTIVPCDYDKYRAASKRVREVFAQYDPDYSMGSLDEAYLDLTECLKRRSQSEQKQHEHERVRYSGECLCRLPRCSVMTANDDVTTSLCPRCKRNETIIRDKVTFGNSVEDVVAEMRFKIEQTTGLTASAGISSNSRLAKICSDRNKPNGQFYLPPDLLEIAEFVKNLPIRKVCGIGGVTEALLQALGVVTCAQLHENRGILALLFSEISVRYFMKIALGVGSNTTSNHDHERKSISVERTFGNTKDPEELFAICKRLCENLAEDVNERELMGKTVTLKLKLATFDVKTRASSSSRPISTFEQIHEKAIEILRKEMNEADELELRLMGVRLSNLTSKPAGKIQQFFSKKSEVGDSADSAVLPEIEGNESIGDDIAVASCAVNPTINYDGGGAIHPDSSNSKPSSAVSAAQNSSPSIELAFCPVCEHKLPGSRSLEELNAHIDDCLSRRTIAEVVNEENAVSRASSSKSSAPAGSGQTVSPETATTKPSDPVGKKRKQTVKKKKETVTSQPAPSGSDDKVDKSTPNAADAVKNKQKKAKKTVTPSPPTECVKMRRLDFYFGK